MPRKLSLWLGLIALVAPIDRTSAVESIPPSPFDPAVSLVAAKVTALSGATQVEVTFRVTHVYCGTTVGTGEGFAAFATNGPSATGHDVRPVPKIGENGIWVVREEQDRKRSSALSQEFCLTFPAREGISARYQQAVALAEAIEKVYRAEAGKSLDLLRQYVFSPVPEVSNWAVRALADASPRDVVKLSERITTKTDIPIIGQVAVDEVMTKVRKELWIQDPERVALLAQWAHCAPNELDARLIDARFSAASQHALADDQALVDAMVSAATNSNFPVKSRRSIVHALGVMSKRGYQISRPALKKVFETASEPPVRDEAQFFLSKTATSNPAP